MVVDEELKQAIGNALSSLPSTNNETFTSWDADFRETSAGWRYLYGVHTVHIIDYDLDQRERLMPRDSTPPAVIPLCDAALMLPPERLGHFDVNFLCLRLEDSTFASRGRLLVLELSCIDALIERLFPNAAMTPAEIRMLMQVVCGIPVRQAAMDDGVSHETKRTQLKAVTAKTGRKGQRDLSAFVLARLMFDLLQASAPPQVLTDVVHTYLDRFLPKSVRLHVIRRRNGTMQRLLEFGNRNGIPLIVLHAQALPSWSDDDIEISSSLGFRMIWPLRHGALDPEATPINFDEHAERACDGIECASELFAGDNFVLVSLMSACWYGIDYARRYPEKVKKLVLIGACYRPEKGNRAPRLFRSGFLRLSSQHRTLAGLLLRFVGQRISDPARLQTFLRTLYADSSADLAVLEAEFADSHSTDSLMQRFVYSERSILHDFLHLGFPNFHYLKELSAPIHFIHGEEDPVHSLKHIMALANSLNAPLYVIPNAGQLMYRQHWPTVLASLSSAVA